SERAPPRPSRCPARPRRMMLCARLDRTTMFITRNDAPGNLFRPRVAYSLSANTTLIPGEGCSLGWRAAGALVGQSARMDPSRKRAVRLTVALTAALLLASALVYTSFSA